jgi:hypothetical protein
LAAHVDVHHLSASARMHVSEGVRTGPGTYGDRSFADVASAATIAALIAGHNRLPE